MVIRIPHCPQWQPGASGLPGLHMGMLPLDRLIERCNMRYSQSEVNKKAPKKEEKKEIPVKAGTKDYDYYNLSSAKKIPTKGGYK